ncbi:DEAD/DEAH box helicase [Tessaracoccus oleiagri]|uniref:Helicase conserved C-terminal domain-containing protein n=1 Tax=Tessaracoccus oleiagri TaxID=686624 RepID=A0A1G9JGU0_9ACTN|nr:DEAD/DEAH box helicase [Tessaracoccus oleiagri]SDL36502.1 Helicase conserved C-terminal domain-containing protein [Tessaracoccus oleiagri]
MSLSEVLEHTPNEPDALYDAFAAWVAGGGFSLYPHQDEALLAILAGSNVIVTTPTGSGKSMIATAAHFAALAGRGRTYYTAPIKALVSEKFFALVDVFGAELVGMVTGDASVNPDAPIIACTAEILANIALREGRNADVDQVVMDEFHFISDPDRGWAWQVPLIELPQAQFVIMSATLGDTTRLQETLTSTTGRDVVEISDAQRPVPLTYRWSLDPIHETIATLVADQQAPVYVVHSTQAAAVEQAQSMLSLGAAKPGKARAEELKEALAGFRFASGFGSTLSKLLRAGIAVHHAGMLPKYRRLVEQLAQRGLLQIICGTDTLGVGINVPIRTVLFASLTKFDGRRMRQLRSREFHQIAGRAGRAGFDTIGYVVAQAPEHEVENAKILAKHEGNEKKLKSVRRKKPPEGFINYTEATFNKLIESQPEELHPRMKVSHSMLLNLLERDGDVAAAIVRLVDSTVADRKSRRALLRRAAALGRSLIAAEIITRLPEPTASGRRYQLDVDLQHDFALNQPLSAFALAVMETMDEDQPDYALDVVSVVEATLENPMTILLQQQFRARGELVAELKADGVEYDERVAILDEVTWPKPLEEKLQAAHIEYGAKYPWLLETPVNPKSIVRDMYVSAMTFAEYVAHLKVQRSEGLLLRYLTDAYRALRQTVPEGFRNDELDDIIAWLGEMTRLVDSSLLDEWAQLSAMTGQEVTVDDAPPPPSRPVTGNERAFRVMVRNALWRRVELMSRDDVDALAALDGGGPMTRPAWDEALGAYWDEHDDLYVDGDARGPKFFDVEKHGRTWMVRQVIDDPEGNHDWALHARVDLDASDEAGELVLQTLSFARHD